MSRLDDIPPSPVKFKHRARWRYSSFRNPTFCSFVFLVLVFIFFLWRPPSTLSPSDASRRSLRASSLGGAAWEKRVRSSARATSRSGISVLVTGAAGFVGSHVSVSLRRRGDGVLGLDNFNSYYDPSLKRARQALLDRSGVFVVDGDINDSGLLAKLFEVAAFTHVMHLAAQGGVRRAMEEPSSYVHSNIAGLVNLLEVCKSADPQPAIVWASSSSVYGLNTKAPFSERDRTDQPASLYAATKKGGEEIAHAYNHIYGLSLTALRLFTVYGPWGRPDMAYFFFTEDILKGRPISIFKGPVARDFTYIDDVVTGCLAALDTAERSTGGGGGRRKKRPAQLRVFNLGNASPVAVADLVSMLEKVLKVRAKRTVRMAANGDVAFTHANISLARRELGYRPTTDLQTGLKKFVQWYVSYYRSGKRSHA